MSGGLAIPSRSHSAPQRGGTRARDSNTVPPQTPRVPTFIAGSVNGGTRAAKLTLLTSLTPLTARGNNVNKVNPVNEVPVIPQGAAKSAPSPTSPRQSSRRTAPFFRPPVCHFPRRPVKLCHNKPDDSGRFLYRYRNDRGDNARWFLRRCLRYRGLRFSSVYFPHGHTQAQSRHPHSRHGHGAA